MKKTERGRTTEYLNLTYVKILKKEGEKTNTSKGKMIDKAMKYYIDNIINEDK